MKRNRYKPLLSLSNNKLRKDLIELRYPNWNFNNFSVYPSV